MSKVEVSRRAFLGLAGSGVAAAGLGVAGAEFALADQVADYQLRASVIDFPLRAGSMTKGMMSFAPDGPAPLLRVRRGQRATIDITNDLGEPTAVRWHGLRIPNDQDGVPYLTQWPIVTGETARYSFAAPDAGTFWYHPHCNTLAQMGRGMTGVLIVAEEDDPGFDQDLAFNLRDFRLGTDNQFVEQFKPRQAARGGTLGTLLTANWRVNPSYDLPAGGLARLRLVATDVTRLYRISIEGAAARLMALDSHPVPAGYQPHVIELGAGQRADVALAVPSTEGALVHIRTETGKGPKPLATLRASGRPLGRSLDEIGGLPSNPVAEPDLANAEVLPFVFGWAPGDQPAPSICGTLGYSFWSINREIWPGDLPTPPGAIARLKLGASYVFRLRNETAYAHPIHLHGLTFRLLKSDKRDLPPLFTDTVVLGAQETIDIGLVADNPGDWAFHCHVIEHQKTGLAAYIRIE